MASESVTEAEGRSRPVSSATSSTPAFRGGDQLPPAQ
jgi:hypothetical protein